MSTRARIGVVGATGAVGTVMLDILSTREDVWGEVRLLASARSAGKVLRCRGEDIIVEELTESSFEGVDVAMFDVPDEISAVWAPIASCVASSTRSSPSPNRTRVPADRADANARTWP